MTGKQPTLEEADALPRLVKQRQGGSDCGYKIEVRTAPSALYLSGEFFPPAWK